MLLPHQSLLTNNKSFIRPNLDYGDVIYDQSLSEPPSNRIESVQYKISKHWSHTRIISKKIYHELCLEHLYQKRWMRRWYLFYEVFHNKV